MRNLKMETNMLSSNYTNEGDRMKIILSERAKELEQTERILYTKENEAKELFAEMWLNTDFKKELNMEKNPTEKDKTSYIRSHPDYKKVKDEIAKYKARKNYQERMFDICFAMKYSNNNDK